MEENININISENLKVLVNQKKAINFYNDLLDFISVLKQTVWFEEYLKNLRGQKKSIEVALRREHDKSSKDFDAKLEKGESKRIFSLQMKSDINQPYDAWSVLKEFQYISQKKTKPWRKGKTQFCWDFNQMKSEYEKLNNKDNDNVFTKNIERYKRAITVLTNDFINFLDKKNTIIEFIGVTYNLKTEKLKFGKTEETFSKDNQSIKFFKLLSENKKVVENKKICEVCLPEETFRLCLMNGDKDNRDFSDKTNDIKRNFVGLLLSLGCKKRNIDNNLVNSKNSGYSFVRK